MRGVERRLRTEDVRGLLRLVGEGYELRAGGECPRAHLVKGLGRIVGAEVSIYMSVLRPDAERGLEVAESTECGWASQRDRDLMYAYIIARPDPLTRAILAQPARSRRVFNRRELVADRTWYASKLTGEVHRPLRLDDVMCASWSGGEGEPLRTLVFKRQWGARPFAEEERDLLALFLDECALLEATTPRPADPPRLAPREARTLSLLQQGRSEKEAAHELGIAPSTLHGYVKDLYRKLRVSSRGELLARYPGRVRSPR